MVGDYTFMPTTLVSTSDQASGINSTTSGYSFPRLISDHLLYHRLEGDGLWFIHATRGHSSTLPNPLISILTENFPQVAKAERCQERSENGQKGRKCDRVYFLASWVKFSAGHPSSHRRYR
jgi:hypothetical protein